MKLLSLLENLNLSGKDGLFFYDDLDSKKVDFLPIRTKDTFINFIRPDAFFCLNKEPLLLFFENPDNLEVLQKQIWNFNQSPIIFINTEKEWIVKNGFKLLENKKDLDTIINDETKLSDFNYFNLITGKTWQDYQKEFEEKNRVDFYLLKNIDAVRNNLRDSGLHKKIANSLIGRVIFISYLIDRKVELNIYGITKKEDFYHILSEKENAYTFFQQIKKDFNGNLFPLEYKVDDVLISEKDKVENKHLSLIITLLQGGEIYRDGSYISSFFNIYDFSIIPIEFVSNVYENFIGKENQAENGAYYTPLFLVDYIQKETVSKYFQNHPTEYNCKVLDPACGSGIFLVETYRQIIAQYKKLNLVNIEIEDEYNKYKEKLKELLLNNIYGVDKDDNAISIAIFSLYITLLDNLTPKSIVGFRFPPLENKNFFNDDFFDAALPFNDELKKHHFQFVLGNPPWATKHPESKQKFEKYIEKRKEEEISSLEIINREIAEAFLVRVSDFDIEEIAFIVVSKILYKLEKKGVFRNYFLHNFKIRQVLELSSVRHIVFGGNKKKKTEDKGVAPATILFYSKSNPQENKENIIKHISLKPNIFFNLFRLLVVEKYDIKEITQQSFIDEDWIWKVFVYGNVLDYYFIKRLKSRYDSIEQIISDTSKFIYGQGLKFKDANKRIKTKDFINYDFIGYYNKATNYNKILKSYYLTNHLQKWDGRDVGYFPKNKELFEAPSLLITGGTTNKFKSVSTISNSNTLYKSSLTGIKAINKNDVKILQNISAILNTSFFAYFIISTGSSTGVEREETHDEEKWSVPFNMKSKVVSLYTDVEKLAKEYYDADMKNNILKNQLDDAINKLDEEVINLFEPSNQERSLIDYANNITIPLLKGTEDEKNRIIRRIQYKEDVLNKYAQVFIEHFGRRFNKDEHYFEVEILHSEYVIMMKFKIISEPTKENDAIVWSKIENKQLISNITELGFENLSDNLFLQKDIKGLEDDYFYIAKPNQYKSWHSALAYLDLSEFVETFHNLKFE